MVEENRKLDIDDVEDFRSEGDRKFSHQSLVMKAMSKVLDLGSKELIEGFLDYNSVDRKGNIKPIYTEDTRRTFIEAVRTCEMVMICDYDETATTNIKEIYGRIESKRLTLLKHQKAFYDSGNYEFKKKNPTDLNYFNTKFQYYNHFVEAQIIFYREIFAELSLLTQRIGFYEEGIYEG